MQAKNTAQHPSYFNSLLHLMQRPLTVQTSTVQSLMVIFCLLEDAFTSNNLPGIEIEQIEELSWS